MGLSWEIKAKMTEKCQFVELATITWFPECWWAYRATTFHFWHEAFMKPGLVGAPISQWAAGEQVSTHCSPYTLSASLVTEQSRECLCKAPRSREARCPSVPPSPSMRAASQRGCKWMRAPSLGIFSFLCDVNLLLTSLPHCWQRATWEPPRSFLRDAAVNLPIVSCPISWSWPSVDLVVSPAGVTGVLRFVYSWVLHNKPCRWGHTLVCTIS